MATNSITYNTKPIKKSGYWVSIIRLTENFVSEGETVENKYIFNIDGDEHEIIRVTYQKKGVVASKWVVGGETFKTDIAVIKALKAI